MVSGNIYLFLLDLGVIVPGGDGQDRAERAGARAEPTTH